LLTHGHRAALLASAAFALLLADAAAGPWTRRVGPEDRGTDYVQGLVTLAVAVTLAALSIMALAGLLSRRSAAMLGVAASAFALAMPLSLWQSLVGDPDPALFHPARRLVTTPGDTFTGTTDLWSAVIAAAACIAAMAVVLLLPSKASHDGEQTRLSRGGVYLVGFAVIALVATLTTWGSGFRWSELGVERTEGLITLVAAFNAMLAGALAVRGLIEREAFARWAFAAGAVMFAAPLWFRLATIGNADPAYEQTLIECFYRPCDVIHAGSGVMLAIVAGAAYLITVAISLNPGIRPDRAPASNWPIRA
jgi:hypothetical protein